MVNGVTPMKVFDRMNILTYELTHSISEAAIAINGLEANMTSVSSQPYTNPMAIQAIDCDVN